MQAKQARTPLIWGQRVEITDETHACFGRVGRYEGVISADLDALRIRFPGGVITATSDQVCATAEHPVHIARRLKAAGLKPARPAFHAVPDCYMKDYGKTSSETAMDAWVDSLGGDDETTSDRLFGEMLRAQRAERIAHRRLKSARAAIKQATQTT